MFSKHLKSILPLVGVILGGCSVVSNLRSRFINAGSRAKINKQSLIPYLPLQKVAKQVKPDNIRFLRFYGDDLGNYNVYHPLVITDKKIIKGFLIALQSAETRPVGMLN